MARGGKQRVKGPTPLVKIWTDPDTKQVYYNQIVVDGETYSCGECVAMEMGTQGVCISEILYIFKDVHGTAWLQNRWLYSKEEVQDALPKKSWPHTMEDAELFETNDISDNDAEAILHRVVVLDRADYEERIRRGTLDENRDFFCTTYLDRFYHSFMPAGEQATAHRLRRGRRLSDRFGGQGLEHDSSSDEDDDDDDDGGDDGDEDDDDDDDGDDDGNDRDAQDGGGGSAGQDTETERRSHKRRRTSSGGDPGGIGGRSHKKQEKEKDKFSVALERLHVKAVPKSLPCRGKERDQLLGFLTSNVKAGGLGDALFVAGMPGTGKTAIAMEVVRLLREQQNRKQLPDFKLVELNGMRLVNPHQAYTQLWMSLSGSMLSPKRALAKLDQYFSDNDPDRQFVVLIVDELDYMTTAKQTVLYNLFEWPSRPNARMVVVGIANTMDLPERCLPRVSSRLTGRLVFPAYTRNELKEILQVRLAEVNDGDRAAFHVGAITMAAGRVAAASGDMRTCLKYCCRAIEVCKDRVARTEGTAEKGASEVTIEDVNTAVKEINQQAHLLAVRDAAPQEKLLLVAICCEVHQYAKDLVEMEAVRGRMIQICRAHPNGPSMPTVTTILEMLSRLGEGQVLLNKLSRKTPMPDAELNMSTREVAKMLEHDTEFSRKVLPDALFSDAFRDN